MNKTLIKFLSTFIVILGFSINSFSQWAGSGNNIYNTNTSYIGINTTSPTNLLTVQAGDISVVETTDYTKMPDGGGADIYLQDKYGAKMNMFAYNGEGGITLGGTASIMRLCQYRGVVVIGASSAPNQWNGTSNLTGYRLYVDGGGILATKLKVAISSSASWSDYVFNKDYKLKSLDEVESYINANKHLPDVPSANEMVKSGLDVASMDAKLLQKIEELTLYMIQLKKQNDELQKKVDNMIVKN